MANLTLSAFQNALKWSKSCLLTSIWGGVYKKIRKKKYMSGAPERRKLIFTLTFSLLFRKIEGSVTKKVDPRSNIKLFQNGFFGIVPKHLQINLTVYLSKMDGKWLSFDTISWGRTPCFRPLFSHFQA